MLLFSFKNPTIEGDTIEAYTTARILEEEEDTLLVMFFEPFSKHKTTLIIQKKYLIDNVK
jgi:hypothetical protein